ncbi:epoxide hydrolase 1 [Mumia zhuanghuii]|uniref:Epoxide hydrolase family protein n=2 Tax=Mumia TaxID=1546255 RepID=A0ABW1QNB1_9ACTN|nr:MULTISPECIES: epoxide hydrolase family protein [Mumia]KAA1424940.1 epoxide hydrolase 1 [Mumia zhuanghuii]
MVAIVDGDIEVAEHDLEDLVARLRATRWPDVPSRGWSDGCDLDTLRSICDWWRDEFDWRSSERRINRAHHVLVDAAGARIHAAVHDGDADRTPLLLLHGWPSSFLEFEQVLPLLRAGGAGTVVVPSLPGYGLSSRPDPWTTRDSARAMIELMATLGHDRFVAHGTDFGSAIGTWMALDHPASVVGLHLSNVELSPTVDDADLTAPERDYLAASEAWWAEQGGYKSIQSTRPDALAVALSDSPSGTAGWVLDRWHAWSDPSAGGLVDRVGLPAIAECLTWTWLTNTLPTSMRDYVDNRRAGTTRLAVGERVTTPTAIARFTRVGDFDEDPPRAWLERIYDLERYERMPRGGHFAALEAADLLARDLLGFVDSLGRSAAPTA